MIDYIKKNKIVIPLALMGITLLYYLFIHSTYSVLNNRESQLFWWMEDSWNERNNLQHAYGVPLAFILFCVAGAKQARNEPVTNGTIGLFALFFGVAMYLISARTIQPRIALIGLPFLISGGIIYVMGWAKGKHFLFASFFWYFALPVPGLNQVTNVLQVVVTKWCFSAGTFFGMDIVNSGNTIQSATDAWDFDIAEGCSGIKSLMALVMIAAIYAYYTQDKLWKKMLLFATALPLAIIGNFFRIFTILVIAEMGYVDIAKGTYHDWSGLVLFFPIALSGLFLVDRLLNKRKTKIRKTIKS